MHNEINFTGATIIDSDIKNKIEVGAQSDSKEKEKLIALLDQLEKQVNLLSENREYAQGLYQDLRKAVEQEDKAKAKDRCELLLKLLSGTASITTILRGIEALLG